MVSTPSLSILQSPRRRTIIGELRMRNNGSGFVVRADGLILTNAHVVAGAREGNLRVHTADGRVHSAHVYAVHPNADLAAIKLDRPPSVCVLLHYSYLRLPLI